MARPLSKHHNDHWLEESDTFGIYNEIEANLLDIIARAFIEDHSLSYLEPVTKVNHDFKNYRLCGTDLPALFVWVQGHESPSNEIGAGTVNPTSNFDSYYVNIIYLYKSNEDSDAHKDVRHAGAVVTDQILANLNLNDIATGGGRLVFTDFEPKIKYVDDKPCSLAAFEIRAVYHRASRRTKSRR